MKKIVLPFVMIVSLSTLVSCGTTNNNISSNLSTPNSPIITGVVVTPTTKTQITNRVSTGSVVTDYPITIPPTTLTPPTKTSPVQIPTTQTQNTPKVVTRKETVAYNNPSGMDSVEFNVTVTDGIITSVSVTPKAENQISLKRQTAFAANVSSIVVGKKAKDLNVDAIGGSSLTTAAFETFVHSL
ncbi:hypothetical protein H7169_00730 [Candidatus Gracilibacteria bacterium]|nr:hypothetical protein [Candidatus Gracilibacteria bacterium]